MPDDASSAGGIKFWMKSNAPVTVEFLMPETTPPKRRRELLGQRNRGQLQQPLLIPDYRAEQRLD